MIQNISYITGVGINRRTARLVPSSILMVFVFREQSSLDIKIRKTPIMFLHVSSVQRQIRRR